jgi:predicted DNA-binding protein YlxM (UPF0122 family)|tara:strand:+ start:13190 stop:13711 length:522 start_codon:yes stop_codon:yes gene_type:complete
MNELSPSKARSNYEFCRDTIALRVNIEYSFLDLGKRLYQIKEKHLYYPNYESFGEFAEEMKMTPTAVSKLIGIYEKFVLTYGFPEKEIAEVRSWQNLAETLAFVKNKTTAKKWLLAAVNMRRNDLRDELNEQRTGIVQTECPHADSYTIKICRKCRNKQVIEDLKNEAKSAKK